MKIEKTGTIVPIITLKKYKKKVLGCNCSVVFITNLKFEMNENDFTLFFTLKSFHYVNGFFEFAEYKLL